MCVKFRPLNGRNYASRGAGDLIFFLFAFLKCQAFKKSKVERKEKRKKFALAYLRLFECLVGGLLVSVNCNGSLGQPENLFRVRKNKHGFRTCNTPSPPNFFPSEARTHDPGIMEHMFRFRFRAGGGDGTFGNHCTSPLYCNLNICVLSPMVNT